MEATAICLPNRAIWEEIERSESYLVCCMFEEAALLASSLLKRLCDGKCAEVEEDIELNDMLESCGMVLVQSLKELGRTSEIMNELKMLFGSITVVPVQVLLTGVYFQMSEGASGVRQVLEEFLSHWRYFDEQYYVLSAPESNEGYVKGCNGQLMLGVDKYLEVVEVYVITLLGRVLGETDLAVSWLEKAALPEEKRQDILRRLHSLSPKITSSTNGPVSTSLKDEYHNGILSSNDVNILGGSQETRTSQFAAKGDNDTKETILKFSGQTGRRIPCFWWFRTIKLKFGSTHQLVISHGNILLGSLVILLYFFLRRRQSRLKRFLTRQAVSMKKALVDLWQLAFSYQVNPLAAVQSLPAPTRGSR